MSKLKYKDQDGFYVEVLAKKGKPILTKGFVQVVSTTAERLVHNKINIDVFEKTHRRIA